MKKSNLSENIAKQIDRIVLDNLKNRNKTKEFKLSENYNDKEFRNLLKPCPLCHNPNFEITFETMCAGHGHNYNVYSLYCSECKHTEKLKFKDIYYAGINKDQYKQVLSNTIWNKFYFIAK